MSLQATVLVNLDDGSEYEVETEINDIYALMRNINEDDDNVSSVVITIVNTTANKVQWDTNEAETRT